MKCTKDALPFTETTDENLELQYKEKNIDFRKLDQSKVNLYKEIKSIEFYNDDESDLLNKILVLLTK